MESMNNAYNNDQGADWLLFITQLNQFIEPVSSLAGRALKAYNADDDSDPIHQLWVMNVKDQNKFLDSWTKLRDKYPPNNFVELGTIVSGREQGMTHYVLSSQKDFKDLVEGSNNSKDEQEAWSKFRSERGETEMVRSFARRLVKKWN
jgi:predicted transcriptional regulator YdeE